MNPEFIAPNYEVNPYSIFNNLTAFGDVRESVLKKALELITGQSFRIGNTSKQSFENKKSAKNSIQRMLQKVFIFKIFRILDNFKRAKISWIFFFSILLSLFFDFKIWISNSIQNLLTMINLQL